MERKSLVKGVGSLALWQLASYAVPLMTYPYLTRVLGPAHYGEFALCFAVMVYFTLIVDWGFSFTATADVARARDSDAELSQIFWKTIAAKALLLLACFLVLGVLCFALPAFRELRLELLAASSLVVANALTLNWLLQGLELMPSFAFGAIIGRLLTVPATLLLVHTDQDVWIANLVQGCGAMVASVISITLSLRAFRLMPPRVTWRDVTAHLSHSTSMFVSSLSANLYTTVNVLIVGAIAGTASAGIYASADRLRAAAQSVINPISQALYPRSTRLFHVDRSSGLLFAKRLLLFQGALTLAISITLCVFGREIITLLAGARYASAIMIFQWLAWTPFLVGLSNVLGIQMMVPLGMQKQVSMILVTAGAINCGLVAVLVHAVGPVGAAMATVTSEVFVTLAMAVWLMRSGVLQFGLSPRSQ